MGLSQFRLEVFQRCGSVYVNFNQLFSCIYCRARPSPVSPSQVRICMSRVGCEPNSLGLESESHKIGTRVWFKSESKDSSPSLRTRVPTCGYKYVYISYCHITLSLRGSHEHSKLERHHDGLELKLDRAIMVTSSLERAIMVTSCDRITKT